MANFEAFFWSFLSSTNLEIMRSESVTVILDSNQISINGFSSKEFFALFMYVRIFFSIYFICEIYHIYDNTFTFPL